MCFSAWSLDVDVSFVHFCNETLMSWLPLMSCQPKNNRLHLTEENHKGMILDSSLLKTKFLRPFPKVEWENWMHHKKGNWRWVGFCHPQTHHITSLTDVFSEQMCDKLCLWLLIFSKTQPRPCVEKISPASNKNANCRSSKNTAFISATSL